jgi:type II secretory pathway predicted ATPase ExeA
MNSISDVVRNFFGLSRIPFSKMIGVNELFQSASFQEAISRLHLALENEDITLLAGPIGCGKSNVLRYFASLLDPHSYFPVYIPAGNIKPGEIAKKALQLLKSEVPYQATAALRKFKQIIITLNQNKGIKPVLFLDEAQELPLPTLTDLKNLLNFEMDSQNLLLIILSGQPALLERLELSSLESLDRRIRIRYHITPLTLAETSAYISHNLKICGVEKPVFTDDTKAQIFNLSKGIISKINKYCFELIIYATSVSKDIIEPSLIDKAGLN